MAHINLLPWRAERRKLREREFYMQLAAAFVAALGVLLLWGFWMGQRIDNQNDRNAYLQTEIKDLDVRIAKIKDLEQVREHLLARKQIIEQLQADRSQMVHLFDELVKTIPSSARLSGLKQNGQALSLDGVAQSNASVAEYMRNIEASQWMGHADLRKTENSHDSSRMPYTFGLDVALSRPKSDEPDGVDGSPAVGPAPATSTTSAPAPAASVPNAPGTAAKTVTGMPAATSAPASVPAKPAAAAAAKPETKAVNAPVSGGTKP
ncbi:PilN domain-containing protein [Rhodanobacter sp. MP7CTX1]|uniref:PilN domain-containing protein n=1 Tax=Rhodanobacter sp. MP7CTX1 TaxID=2723084 RepID=UPI001618D3FD|nr:PilN domain-containing protein [Rhodanobacter sp. MP7CTX1]MBB6186576.1 type IV pilus assembly protein PilN [Rhodanobacter sp. MP7CTX1]